jgi:hypothetical protein
MNQLRRTFLLAACCAAFVALPSAAREPASAAAGTKAPVNAGDGADPRGALLARFRRDAAVRPTFSPSGLRRRDYLKLIGSEVDFWKRHQDANGAIIDPYRQAEFQYATPAFTHAAALLVADGGRLDLREPAAKAMDWATRCLSQRKAASAHEDFYAPMLGHALTLLRPYVDPGRVARWENDIRRFDPGRTYRSPAGRGNWNVVALSGEARFQRMGLRPTPSPFLDQSLAGQTRQFTLPYGLYLEGAMAYDHFPRVWAGDMIADGFNGPNAAALRDRLSRAAVASLFMQSPWGELPAGGRSAQHQWNEASECVTFEIYAAEAKARGDIRLAGVYKRAARLALGSMRRWVRPTGEMQIAKNWVDPAKGHAYESYSSHSQYNLLAMSMLAIAAEHAAKTEQVAEQATPADVGGFVLHVPQLHKVFANAGGTYVEIETKADPAYDATGLIRVHARGVSPQLGPSDSVPASPKYSTSREAAAPPQATGVGISWSDGRGGWHRLGEVSRRDGVETRVKVVQESPGRVAFDVAYEGDMAGVSRVIEHYVLTPGRVELTTELPGYAGPLRYVWPVLADNGAKKSDIRTAGATVTVSQDGGQTAQTFTAVGASGVRVESDLYPNHNGWARLGVAEFPAGRGKATLVIAPGGK